MTIQIPEPVQWLVPVVVGTDWPESDEDALRRLAEAWERAATAISQATGEGNVAARAALGTMQGEAADAFAEYWDRFVSGDEQFLGTLEQACADLAEGCDEAALNVEYTKLAIIAALLILAAQIAAMIAAAFATFGASTAGIPIAQAATRITVQLAFRELIRQIAISVTINVGVDAAIQGLQVAGGDRESWDLAKTADAGIAGAAAGVAGSGVGLASDALGRSTSNFGAAALRGAGEGAIAGAGGNALNDLAHGTAPSLQSLGLSAASGSVGGALDGTANRHQGLPETWHSPENSDYTDGTNAQGLAAPDAGRH
ncbi:MAG TPA: hypothetical protein VK887_03515 [Pseudonocardiaceae bacterium]|nr:hypothetical protein [Pseudonocardiaceae bacterium]